jgi:hypothetical protein
MTITLDAIPLPPSLLWEDEFDAAPVVQTVQRTLAGGLLVQYGGLTAGRPITLASQSDAGWATRTTVQALQQRAAVPGGIYALSLRGVTYSVMFRHHEAPALAANPLIHLAAPADGSYYLITLRLITV